MKISVASIRGIVGEDLTPKEVFRFGLTFGHLLSDVDPDKPIIIGRDSRASGSMIKEELFSALFACGKNNILDIGIAPTPTVLHAVRHNKCAGGIIITASHNPKQWNGLKWVSSEGKYYYTDEWNQFMEIYNKNDFQYQPSGILGFATPFEKAKEDHIKDVLKIAKKDAIRSRKFKVALDSGNGAGGPITKALLEKLNCEVVDIYTEPDGNFQRGLEPLAHNLKDLEKLVQENGCDVGFAQDPDADRLAIVSEKGIAIGEEYTLALSVNEYLKTTKSDVTINSSTSRMIDDIAKQHQVKVIRTFVGESHVVNCMLSNNSKIGGEGNGGVIIPEINTCRDSLVGIVMILNALVDNNCTVTELTEAIPKYSLLKDRIKNEGYDLTNIYKKIEEKYSNYPISNMDGLKIDFEESWVQIRESNTEPIIRIFAEAKSEQLAKEKIDEFKEIIVSS